MMTTINKCQTCGKKCYGAKCRGCADGARSFKPVFYDDILKQLREGKSRSAIARDRGYWIVTVRRYAEEAVRRGDIDAPPVREKYTNVANARTGALSREYLAAPTEVRKWITENIRPGQTLAQFLMQLATAEASE